jgi:hypothetical protein
MCVSCSRCEGTGEADPQTEGGSEIGGTHQMPAPTRHQMPAELPALWRPIEDLPPQQLNDLLAWLLD